MKNTLPITFAALLLNACCSDCPERNGTFEIRFTETSGTCGEVPTQVITGDQPDEPADPCVGDIITSDDNCTVTNVDIACPSLNPGVFQVTNGKFEWDCDNTMTGAANIRFEDSFGVVCQSSYDVEAEEL